MKYHLASIALRGFSSTHLTRYAYRKIGNIKRDYININGNIGHKYFVRTQSFLEILNKHKILKDDIDVLEIGTGWVHWESLILRNQIDCRALLYDVWDNRSFRKLQSYAGQLTDPDIRTRLGLDAVSGAALMDQVSKCRTRAEAYALLNFSYLLDPSGALTGVPDEHFDLVVSSDVGEHIPRDTIPMVLARSFQALRPGGWAYHQIVIADHLTIYDRSIHPKEYLKYSREYYESALLSDVQYINLVQTNEWAALFQEAGFDVVEMNRIGMSDLAAIDVHPSWQSVPSEDLACTVVQFLVRRPEA